MHTLEQLRSGALQGIRRLKLCCGLTEFPREIFSLADTLEILDLTGNELTTLPEDLDQLTELKVIFCSQNQFTQLPAVLGRCPSLSMVGFKSNQIIDVPADSFPVNLRWLILTDNAIASLPESIGECDQLQKLMLAGNQLTDLPDSLVRCQRLELIRLAANKLTCLPEWLLALPRLTWLAYAGNPFSAPLEQQALALDMAEIDWQQLDIGELLGEGASGLIYRANWIRDDACYPVAVKLFKGAMTSDGLPLCEMASTMKAGQHRALTHTLGRIHHHPEGSDGLVMKLIPAKFDNLAGPPSLESCTRDVYQADVHFSAAALFKLAISIADGVLHLHQQGVIHGDLYAHNILVTPSGEALLSDYGAASFFDVADATMAPKLQRMEVRAFGYLLQELSERCAELSTEVLLEINALIASCLQPEMMARPNWAQISEQLKELSHC